MRGGVVRVACVVMHAMEVVADNDLRRVMDRRIRGMCIDNARQLTVAVLRVRILRIVRGLVTGLMTAAGGIGHTLPFLVTNFHAALVAAMVVVGIELAIISYVRHRYMDTPLFASSLQVVVGGGLVFAVGIIIGSS